MTMKLNLGVADIPYVNAKGITTGEVAEILEDKYHIMEIFFNNHDKDVAKDLEQSVSGALEMLLISGRLSKAPFAEGTSKIEKRFKQFLSSGEIEKIGYPGVPTRAALEGRSSRKKNKKRRGRRPSFIDTGLYQNSFKAWVNVS